MIQHRHGMHTFLDCDASEARRPPPRKMRFASLR
jgi:hypothetical protein